jgi:DNA-binding response OmpR family regulator
MRILVVDDDQRLAGALRRGLRREGHAVDVALDGHDGRWLATENRYDALVLDSMMPGMTGEELCVALRREGDWTPVLILTARTGERQEADALDSGADDYLSKPFSPRELTARAGALLRRARAGATEAPADAVLEAGGGLVLVPVRHLAMLDDIPLPLTPAEVDVLAVLAREPGRPWERSALVGEVWGGDFIESDFLIDVHVASLRRKLRKAGAGRDRIRTVDASAYVLQPA